MIPQRKPRNDFAGSELRERVTACRKRLRHNRFPQASGREIDQDGAATEATFLDDQPAMRESLPNIELSSTGQEVGIT